VVLAPFSRALSGGEHEFASDVASLADPLGVSGAFKWIGTSYRRGQVATRGQLRQPGQIARRPVLRRASTEGYTQLPGGRVRDMLAAMVRVWSELDGIEREHKLSFLREPDMGFAWNAHAWAQGRRLETVLETGLTPGDFVRAAKQLIDLLDQVALAAGQAPLGAKARAAIDALRRGVVAYSSVG